MSKTAKNILITFCIGIIIFVIGSALQNGFRYTSAESFLITFGFYQLYSFVLGYSNFFYFGYLEKLKWRKKDKFKRIAIGIIGSIVITLIGLFILRMLTAIYVNGRSFEYFIEHETFMPYQFGLWITLTIVIIFHLVYFSTI